MGRKLTGLPLEHTPLVTVNRLVGGYLIATKLSEARQVKMSRGIGQAYEMSIEDTSFPVTMKNEKGGYDEVEVNPGDKITVLATTVLHKALQQALIGERLKIEYIGKKPGKIGDYCDYVVEVLDVGV